MARFFKAKAHSLRVAWSSANVARKQSVIASSSAPCSAWTIVSPHFRRRRSFSPHRRDGQQTAMIAAK
jgi:hypothetical protein